MKKFVALISASTLATATALAPILTVPAVADENMTARAYFSLKFGSGVSMKDSAQYGFQLKQSWDRGDDVIDPFAAPRSLTVFDFAMGSEGLAKANVLGLDTIAVYDIWTGKDRFNLGFGGGGIDPDFIFAGLFGGLVIWCVAAEWGGVPFCNDNNNNPPPPPPD